VGDGWGKGVDACCAVGCKISHFSFFPFPGLKISRGGLGETRTGEFVDDGLADGVCCVGHDADEAVLGGLN
jgi:hypothetical protein